jgi:hypothetical protein
MSFSRNDHLETVFHAQHPLYEQNVAAFLSEHPETPRATMTMDEFIATHPEAYVIKLKELYFTPHTHNKWDAVVGVPVVLADNFDHPSIFDAITLIQTLDANGGVNPITNTTVRNWRQGAIAPVIIRDSPLGVDAHYFPLLQVIQHKHSVEFGDWRKRALHAKPLPPPIMKSADAQPPHAPPPPLPTIERYHGIHTLPPQDGWPLAPWEHVLSLPGFNTLHGFAQRVSEKYAPPTRPRP